MMTEATGDKVIVEPANIEDFSASENFDIHSTNSISHQDSTAINQEHPDGEIERQTEHSKNTSKRKKIDKDGFVQPSTPEVYSKNARYSTDEFSDVQSDLSPVTTHKTSQQPEESVLCTSASDPEIKESESQPASLVNLLKELGEETKSLYSSWAEVFNDSENFEMFCPTRLDKILQETLALEENLQQQKERLRNRLHALSHTLQLP